MNGRFKDLLRLSGGEWLLSFVVRDDPRKLIESVKDHELSIDVKKRSKKRSKSANDFLWALCTDIGNAIRPPVPKEEVYRKVIRDNGVFVPLPIREDAVERFQRTWSSKGIGWFADVVDDCKIPGYKKVFAYYGSSTYTVEEMGRLIESLKAEAENMELVIPISKEEEERMLARWGGALSKMTSNPVTSAEG